ncbi:MAG: ferritin-like domain-containing protein [Burkholderiales bacterium]
MGARLLPRTLPELFAYSLALERNAARRYAELEQLMREVGVEPIADEFEKLGREEQEQYELIKLGTSGRPLPEVAGWELSWHFMGEGAAVRVAPRSAREAIASALAFERQTQAFYVDIAERARDDAVRAFSAEMANDEQRHIARLEVLLEREPEPTGLEGDEPPSVLPTP